MRNNCINLSEVKFKMNIVENIPAGGNAIFKMFTISPRKEL